jgi:hypothetical protein
MKADERSYDATYAAFTEYLAVLEKVKTAFETVGIETGNVDAHANFAEVLVARRFEGTIQKATNNGTQIQVKSLKNSSKNLGANGLGWYSATREKDDREAPLIEADCLAIVAFLDYKPFALLTMKVELRDSFPGLDTKAIGMSQIKKILAAPEKYAEIQIEKLEGVLG